MNSTNIIELTIDEKAHGYARIYASLLKEEFQRKRAYASIAALYSFINLLEKTPSYKLQKSMTLFRNPDINEQYEISDLYVNDWHIDVRAVTGGDAVLVPKIHYDSDIVPDFYVVIKVDSKIQNAELLGIIDTSAAEKEGFDYHYYSIPFTSFISYNEFLDRTKVKKNVNLSEESHNLFQNSYLGLMDNEIDIQTKNKIIKHLFECNECRTEFCCFTGFEMVSANASKYPDILNDHMLDVIGAQDSEKYEVKEEIIPLNDDETGKNLSDKSDNEETVSDILDELFDTDEEFNSSVSINDKPLNTELSDIPDLQTQTNENNIETITDNDDADLAFSLPVIQENDMQLLYENEPESLQDFDSEITAEKNNQEELIGDIELIEESPDEENTISDTQENKTDDTQKVIIDYDEYGEPVYSYITPIEQETTEETQTIDIIDDRNLDFARPVSMTQPSINKEIYEDESSLQIIDDDETTDSLNTDESKENSETEYIDKEAELYEPSESNTGSDVHPYEIELEEDNELQSSAEKTDIEPESENSTYNDDEETQNTDEEQFEEYQETDDEEYSDEMEEFYDENDENEEYPDETKEFHDEDGEHEEEGGEYDDYDIEDVLPDENVKKSSSKMPLILISLIIILGLTGVGTFLFIKNNNNKTSDIASDNQQVETPDIQQMQNDMFEQPQEDVNNENNPEGNPENNPEGNHEEIPEGNPEENPDGNSEGQQEDGQQTENHDENSFVPPLTENDLIQSEASGENTADVNNAMVNAFSQNNNNISLRGLNWFCTSELFSDRTFKHYLQDLDNTLKQNLRNNILNASSTPPNNLVEAKFAVDNDGNLQKVIISNSSGSEEIDNIVLQSINESFNGEKSQILNDSALKSDRYYLKVVIKL